MAKIIVNENTFRRFMESQMMNEEFTKKDAIDIAKHDSEFENRIKDIVRNAVKNDSEIVRNRKDNTSDTIRNNKELEKKIKSVTADVLDKYFKLMWQRSGFYANELKN